MGSVLLFFLVSRGKTKKTKKKQKGRTYVPVSGMGSVLLVFLFFWFLEVKPKKQKKQKGRTYVPVSGMGSVLLVFLVFLVSRGKTKKTQKTKKVEPMSQYLAWGQYFCFFLFLEVKQKNKKKRQNLCPSIWHGVSTFGFFVFVFFKVFAIFWYLTWVLPFCFVYVFFSRFLQFSGFCNFAFLVFQGFCNIRPFLIRL